MRRAALREFAWAGLIGRRTGRSRRRAAALASDNDMQPGCRESVPRSRPSRARRASSWAVAAALAGLVAALISVSSHELWSAGMLTFGDLAAFPDHAGAFVDAFHRAWAERGLGGPFAASPGVLVAALLVLLARGNAELAQYVYLAAWIPIAFVGMTYLCRRWLAMPWGVALAGGIVYATTPVAIGLVIAGAGGLIWAYALAPAVIATAERVRIDGFRAVGWFAAALALFSAFTPELLIFGYLIAAIWVLSGRRGSRVFPAMAFAVALATLAALPGIVGRGQVRGSERLVEKAVTDFSYTYDKASLPSLLRLAGNQGDPMDPLGYNGSAAWTFAGFLPCMLVVGGLVWRRRNDGLPLRLAALAAAALCALLGLALVAERHPPLLEGVPALLVFRNPEKLMILLAAPLVAGAMYGAHRVLRLGARRRPWIELTALAVLAVYLVVYARPAFSGDWGVKRVRGDAFVADQGLLAAARHLERTDPGLPGKWRVAWVPFSSTDVLSLEWVLPQWANDPVLESRDPEIEDTTDALRDSLAKGDMGRFHRVADPAAVKYIVLRRNADPETARAIRNDARLKRGFRGRGFEVWRNEAALPRIRSFTRLTAVVFPKRPRPVEFESRALARLTSDALVPRSGWTVHPGENFTWAGRSIRIRTTRSAFWPVLARRIRAYGATSYVISAWVRTRNAAGAHLKAIWYRRRSDPEIKALEHDYAKPVLSGNHGWTHLSGVVKSPRAARFGELMFLAGKRPVGSRRAAVSWVRDLRIAHYYTGGSAPIGVHAVANIPELARRDHEIVDPASLESIVPNLRAHPVPIDVIVVNPRFRVVTPISVRKLRGRAGPATIVAQAAVALQPRVGVWRRNQASAQVASDRGEALIPFGVVESARYVISVVGCGIAPASMSISLSTKMLRPRLLERRRSCGRSDTSQPVALKGRTIVRVSLRRGASIAAVQASPTASRQVTASSGGGALRITAANTPSPRIRGLSSGGLALADAFNADWRTSGSDAIHFRTLLGFNGFLVENPPTLSGLAYGGQQTRNRLLLVSAIGWLAIAGLLAFPAVRRRAALRPRTSQ